MPVTVVPSSRQSAAKKKSTSHKRRQNQNEEIHELASLVPLSSSQLGGLIPNNGGNPQTMSVLRLTTTFLKLQSFIKDGDVKMQSSADDLARIKDAYIIGCTTSPLNSADCEPVSNGGLNLGRMEEAIDGFLIVLDKDANILYVSETIAGHVGLIQQDVIGQNFADITHPEFVAEIRDSLKPSVLLPTSMSEDVIISQYRQFFVRIVPSVAYSTSPSHSIVQVRGNLKVKLSPSNITTKGGLEFIEPAVIGFVGECRVVEIAASILEISIPHSSFVITRSLDMQKVISVESSVKDVVGYDPEVILAADLDIADFLHPSDQNVIAPLRNTLLRNGHVLSPHFRFLTSSGEWVWLQLEGKLCSNFWEIKIRALGQWGRKLKYIEQRELYSSDSDQDTYRKNDAVKKYASTLSKYCTRDGAKPIIDSLKSTSMPESVLEPMLHGRSVAMNDFSELMKQMNTTSTTSMKHAHDQAFPTISSKLSSPNTTTNAHIGLSTKSSKDASSSHVSSCSQISTSDQSKPLTSADNGSECAPKVLLATEPIAQSQFSQQLPEESCHSILTVPNPVELNLVQSPLMSGSDIGSSPTSSTMMISPQQDFISSPEQFLDFTSPIDMCPSHNSAVDTDFSPPSAYPADMDIVVPQTVAGADSIPFTTSVPFPYSQTPNFIPQAPSTTNFNPQIPPSDFNFLSNTNPQDFDTAPCLDVQSTCMQAFHSSNPPLNDNASDSLMQQIIDEMMDESNFNPTTSVSDYMNSAISSSHPQADPPVLNSRSLLSAGSYHLPSLTNAVDQGDASANFLCDSQTNVPSSGNSNLEIQDILQQFM